MRVMPDLPATILGQACATPIPTGETIPKPVTTTLRLAKVTPLLENKNIKGDYFWWALT